MLIHPIGAQRAFIGCPLIPTVRVSWEGKHKLIRPFHAKTARISWEGKRGMTIQNVIYIILATLSLISVVGWLVARLTGRTPCTLIGRQGVRLTMERTGYALYWSPTNHLQVHLNPIGWVLFTWRRQGNGQQIGLWFLMLYLSHD